MLHWLLSILFPRRRRREALQRADAEAFLIRTLMDAGPLTPPRAANDDVLADVAMEVERELRRAGYLH
jgi:hypothetical protein